MREFSAGSIQRFENRGFTVWWQQGKTTLLPLLYRRFERVYDRFIQVSTQRQS
jgi:hypothetical protein